MGGLTRLLAQRVLGSSARNVPEAEWPEGLRSSGFRGSAVFMGEPVVDMPSLIRALAEPWRDNIRRIGLTESEAPIEFLRAQGIEAKAVLFTGAAGNERIARDNRHDEGLDTQHRPLLQGMLKPAPFPLYAHFVGRSDKPVATITTHEAADGSLVWYLGAAIAERPKQADPAEVYAAARKAFATYLPKVDLTDVQWATWPIDRVEGKSASFWLPDAPTVHRVGNVMYGWPTKLTFTPMLGDMVAAELDKLGIEPSHRHTDFSDLPPVDYAAAPWDKAKWTSPE